MGNRQSRDGFEGVLPSGSAAKVPISQAWTGGSSAEDGAEPLVDAPPLVGKTVPPGHALQVEEKTSRLSLETSEVVRAFNNVQHVEDDRFVVPESVRKSRTLDAFVDVCSEILPGFLYVSNFQVARDAAKLRALGITRVINCCGELKHCEDGVEHSSDSEFQVLKLLLRDDANEDLTPFFPQVMEFIAACRQREGEVNGKGDKVLVHCHQGVSRSCAFAIAYVMMEQGLSYHEAAALVKRQRAISSPNAAFICQLLEWEKDLQAIKSHNGSALGGLYRLAPHSSYNPEYFVLKRCYDPRAGSARQRQNLAIVRAPEDEQRLLWSHGTFVFQSPTNSTQLTVWHGSKCEIPNALSIATKLASQLIRMQTLMQPPGVESTQIEIVEVEEDADGHKGTDSDHFGCAAELQWSRGSIPKTPAFFLPTNGDTSDSSSAEDVSILPQLFVLEAVGEEDGQDVWEQLTNYDSEDLTPDSALLLCSIRPQGIAQGYVWLGTSCSFTPEIVVNAAQKQIQSLQNLPDLYPTTSLVIERQNQESDAFWQLFEAGY
ncbi:hypothetical protein PF008_g8488 [Phytophthora fragariae]|uniref:Uncharacterized protein n=1 Tax=Phytophthora fragariae TaxID=53985 RepID=A0A6G0S144_9STRA|nr:hypothetical protein PF008_g8488 [Phytophthora fragariae]